MVISYFFIARVFMLPTETCPDGVESENSNEVSCYNQDQKCVLHFVWPPKNLQLELKVE